MDSIIRTRLDIIEVIKLLEKFDNMFTPSLSTNLDLKKFNIKLSEHAEFVLSKEGEDTIGFIAYYNNKEQHQYYITLLCVSKSSRTKGIASKMLHFLEDNRCRNIDSISLEVKKENYSALKFYLKHNFAIKEDRNEKFLMEKKLY